MKKIALIAILLIAGCGVKKPLEGRADPYDSSQIMFANPDLRKLTAVGTPKLARDAAGLLFVTVPIRAATDLKLYIDYRFTYFDETGQPIYTTGWFNKTLEPNVSDQVTGNSTTPRAADFQVDFRYAQ